MMRDLSPQFVRSKIVCTIGPASETLETLKAMAEAGMDVARVNFSHGDEEARAKIFNALAEVERVSTLVDLPGPKIRLGEVDGRMLLRPGDEVHFTTHDVVGSEGELPVSYGNLPREIRVGGSLFIDDGLIEVAVTSIDGDEEGFTGGVISAGEVSSHKGLNVPGAYLSVRTPTEADLKGIKQAVDLCDWFAISFVRDRGDVEAVKRAIKGAGGDQPVISKIEHREAVVNLDAIIDASDGLMVARGDLGIEVPPWEVPLLQKRMISRCNREGKPVIVATQMLESMVVNPRPTRAEASDVANAILDGADAVMLSAETAVGLFPVETVKAMNSISRTVEQVGSSGQVSSGLGGSIADIIGGLSSMAAGVVKPAAIIVVTRTGFSARMVSKHRPPIRILAVTSSPRVARRVRLYWGVEPLDVEWTDNRDELLLRSVKGGMERGYIGRGDSVMIVSGSSLEPPGRTNALEILNVGDVLGHASRRG